MYDELRKLAAARMATEAPGHTLNATALVHEAYLRLVGDQQFDGRGHFFAAAAEAMRRILVESARRKKSLKRGGDRDRADFDLADLADAEQPDEVLAIDEALADLAMADPQAAELVKLRYFVGLSVPAAAATMNISPRSAERPGATPVPGSAGPSRGVDPASKNLGKCWRGCAADFALGDERTHNPVPVTCEARP